MAYNRTDGWETSREVYTPNQVAAVLREIGVEVRDETESAYLCYCVFHGNRDTPAFAVNKVEGTYICFNPACDVRGSLKGLVRAVKGFNHIDTARLIKRQEDSDVDVMSQLEMVMDKPFEFVEFPQHILDRGEEDLWTTMHAQDYMLGRGFTPETLKYFGIGYSAKQDMIIVPMHDPKGMPIGLVGRPPSHTDKRFKNSTDLPKSHTLWNLHRARRYETVIIVEASFDAMKVHQAGYPNVVALLGGSLSKDQEVLLKRHFSRVILMVDNDKPQFHVTCAKCKRNGFKMCQGHKPGEQLGLKIAERCNTLDVRWANYSNEEIYARNVKDATDMTDDEIRQCLRNAISHYEYLTLNVL